MTPMQVAGRTDVGRQRRDNQDAFICQPIWSEVDDQVSDHQADALAGNPSMLLVVIDGVGGYAGGDRAAAIAREAILRYMETPTGDTLTMLREAVVYANNQIDQARRQEPQLSMMCCVLTAAVADHLRGKVYFVHVGDTRLYRFRPDSTPLEKLTSDHSVVGIREDANQLTEAEAMQHPRRNEVLRTVGSAPHRIDDIDFLESGEADLVPGDGLLLCSDGLTDMLPRSSIQDVLSQLAASPASLTQQVDELIRQANEQGGHDNITVVLALNVPEQEEREPANVPENEEHEPGNVPDAPVAEPASVEATVAHEAAVLPAAAPVLPQPVPDPAAPRSGNWWLIGALLAFMAVVTYFFLIR